MNVSKIRGLIIFLSFCALLSSLAFENKWVSLILMTVCILAAIAVLYLHLEDLSDISPDNPKMQTLKTVTIFNSVILALCVVFAILTGTGIIRLDNDGRYFAAAVLSSVLLFAGNISPKLPFSKHTGLRLPWTVRDEETWIVAHRILGYISIPLAFVYISGVSLIPDFKLWTLIIVVLWIGIPGGLSYIFFRKRFL